MATVVLGRGALLLDSGGISAIAAGDATARAALVRARREGRQVAIPAAVLVETTTERPDHALIDRVIKSVDLEIPLTPARARESGILRARVIAAQTGTPRGKERPPSTVDATVMAEAASIGAAIILTSDLDDLALLRDVAGLSSHEVQIVAV